MGTARSITPRVDPLTGMLMVSIPDNISHTTILDNLSAGALGADLLPMTDVGTYKSANIQITGTWSGTLTFQGSNDGINFVNIIAVNLLAVNGFNGTSTNGNGLYTIATGFKYFRVKMTSYTSGTATGICLLSDLPAQTNILCASVQNTVSVSGPAGEGATPIGSPLRLGVETRTTLPAARNDNQMNKLIGTTDGRQVVHHYQVPELTWQFACSAPTTDTTDVVVAAAEGGSVRNYITSFQYQNTGTVATEIVIKDGIIGPILWRCTAPANMNVPVSIVFPVPLRGTANYNVYAACMTADANVYFNAQGYKAY